MCKSQYRQWRTCKPFQYWHICVHVNLYSNITEIMPLVGIWSQQNFGWLWIQGYILTLVPNPALNQILVNLTLAPDQRNIVQLRLWTLVLIVAHMTIFGCEESAVVLSVMILQGISLFFFICFNDF